MARFYVPYDFAEKEGYASFILYEFKKMDADEFDNFLTYSRKCSSKTIEKIMIEIIDFCVLNNIPTPYGWTVRKDDLLIKDSWVEKRGVFKKNVYHPKKETFEAKIIILFHDKELPKEVTRVIASYIIGIRTGIGL